MSNKIFYVTTGVSAILGTLLILVANLGGMFTETPNGLGSKVPEESLSVLVATPGPVLLSGWFNIYGALLIAIAVNRYLSIDAPGWLARAGTGCSDGAWCDNSHRSIFCLTASRKTSLTRTTDVFTVPR